MSTRYSLPGFRSRAAWIFGNDFDIDQIIGVANLKVHDIDELASLAMSAFDPDFRTSVEVGDVLIGGHNFGYGHPHAQAMKAMRHLGIKAVIAESFFSSYWIGEIGYGFVQVVCPGITSAVQRWDELEVDFAANVVRILRTGQVLPIQPYSEREIEVLRAGGLRKLLEAAITTSSTC